MMNATLEDLLALLSPQTPPVAPVRKEEPGQPSIAFSFLFFSDVHKDIADADKYEFVRHLTLFADREGFTAVYFPERHFHEFGSIYANPAVVAAYLIPQTKRIRFRTAGVSLSLHHPAEVVEWWSMNDVLSGGRIDLGFGSGWNRNDFIISPDTYEQRKQICSERIEVVQRLWRGEKLTFPGPGGDEISIATQPRPRQKELNVWLLITANDDAFLHAGRAGYNVFTMLYGYDLETLKKKIALYRQGRKESGLRPETGVVTLMLHTLVHKDRDTVQRAVEGPFKKYIKSALDAHVQAGVGKDRGAAEMSPEEKDRVLEYSFNRYYKTCAIFGTVEDGKRIVEKAMEVGVDEIACLVDFGADYALVKDSLNYLRELTAPYISKRLNRIDSEYVRN